MLDRIDEGSEDELSADELDQVAGGILATVQFEGYEQKASQSYQLLSSTVKTLNDLEKAVIRKGL